MEQAQRLATVVAPHRLTLGRVTRLPRDLANNLKQRWQRHNELVRLLNSKDVARSTGARI